MRCHRCHAKLDPGRKTCPHCGTLIRKRRGSVTLAPEAGGGRLPAAFKSVSSRINIDIDPRVVLLCIFAVIAVAFVVCMAQCDACSSCGACAQCSACSSCGSCSGCAQCSSCGSCTACESCGSCSSCGSKNSANTGDNMNYAPSRSREFYRNGTLYYIDKQNIVALSDSGNISIIAEGSGISNLYADERNVYYMMEGNLWAVPLKKTPTISDDPAVRYGAFRIINATATGSDAGVKAIYGYGITDGYVCYWGPTADGSYAICCKPLSGGETRVLRTGAYHMVQCYRGNVFLLGRDEADYGMLYKINLATGEKAVMFKEEVYYFTLSSGSVYATTWKNSVATLYRIDMETGEATSQWGIESISGILANDHYIYYCVNANGVGHIYRMTPDGKGKQEIFTDNSTIQLCGISGDYFSLYIDVDYNAENRYANATYYIINSVTGEKLISK